MSRRFTRMSVVLLTVIVMVAAGCGGDDDDAADGGSKATDEKVDYEAIGLWDDGPCDKAKDPLKIGLMTVFESPLLSLEDQALALEASAEAFNARGGANGSCIEVTTCDDGANVDQAVECVKKIDEAGVVATVNDQGTEGQDKVSADMSEAGIPRIASNVTDADWADPNAYPLDASGTGVTFLQPQALIDEGAKKIGLVRVDLARASALLGFMEQIYEGKAEFVSDAPVPSGTTEFTQFIIGAQDKGADSVSLSVGEQEAVQVAKAGQQVDTDLQVGASLGSFAPATLGELGDFAKKMIFVWSFAPATADIPVYKALRQDLAKSGEEGLQPESLKTSPMRSWIGLYALLKMIRDEKMTKFTREGIKDMLDKAKDVPMLDMFGGEDWTPNEDHPGAFKRAGIDRWSAYRFDPDKEAATGEKGTFVEGKAISFDEVLCGTLGAPKSEC